MENSMAVPQNIKQYYWMFQQFSFGVYTKKAESKDSSRYLYTHVHSSIICGSQKLKATQVSIR